MNTREKVKKGIDKLSGVELEKAYLYLTSLTKEKKKKHVRSLKLDGKLDTKDIRSIAYE